MWATSFPIHQIQALWLQKTLPNVRIWTSELRTLSNVLGSWKFSTGFPAIIPHLVEFLWPVFPPIFPRRYIQKQRWYSYLLSKQASSVICLAASSNVHLPCPHAYLSLLVKLCCISSSFPHRTECHIWASPSVFSAKLLAISMKIFRNSAGRSEIYLIAAIMVLILKQKAHSWLHLFWFSRAHFIQGPSHRVVVLLDVLL